MRPDRSRRRGQADIDRLLVFVLGVAALVFVVPILTGMAGIDLRGDGSASAGNETVPSTTNQSLVVLDAYGTAIDQDRESIGVVELTVGGTDSGSVDLSGLSVSWTSGGSSVQLVPANASGGDASFTVEAVSGTTVLAQSGDRAIIRFDLGTDDIDGADHFGNRLTPGQSSELSLSTGDGPPTEVTITVPTRMPDGIAVGLDIRRR